MLKSRHIRGFTLVELMVGLTLLAILMALGVPSLSSFLQSAKLSNAAKNYYTGVQSARSEAIRRNAAVEFMLTDSAVVAGTASEAATFANSATPSANGRNWLVRWYNADPAVAAYQFIEARSGAEGAAAASGTTPSVGVTGTKTSPSGTFSGTISFNGLGGTSDGASYALDVDNAAGGACVSSGGPMRCQRIRVSGGGQVRLCDPAAATGDSRACQ